MWLVSIILLIGILAIYSLIRHNDRDSTKFVEVVLDDYLQTMSIEKPFAYFIITLEIAEQSPMVGDVWCIVIDPPIRTRVFETPSHPEVVAMNHFAIIKAFDRWNGLMFQNNEQEQWLEIGCKGW